MQTTTKIAIAVAGLAGFASAALAADPAGTWTRPSTGAQVSFYDCGGKLCAKVASVKDKARQGDVGKVIMSGAAKTSDNTWKGDLVNLEDGKTYTGIVTLKGPSALNLAGCVLGGLICKDETWTK